MAPSGSLRSSRHCGAATQPRSVRVAKHGVSGTVSVMAVWTRPRAEARSRQCWQGFKNANPGVTVKYTSAGDQLPTQLSTAVAGGNPPDLAALPQPGLMKDFVEQERAEVDRRSRKTTSSRTLAPSCGRPSAPSTARSTASSSRRPTSRPSGTTSRRSTPPASTPPKTWDDFMRRAQDAARPRALPAYSIGGADGWTLTDLFENIYLRQAGPDKYDQLANHEIPWTDAVGEEGADARWRRSSATPATSPGATGALQTDFPTSVTNVFSSPPKAAMVIEGDFVPGVITSSTKPKPVTGFNVFAFPSIDGSTGIGRSAAATPSSCSRTTPPPEASRSATWRRRRRRDLGQARRLRVAEQEGRSERLPRPDHPRRPRARSARRRCSASTSPTSSRRRSAARSGRACSSCSRTSWRNPRNVDGVASALEKAAAAAYKRVVSGTTVTAEPPDRGGSARAAPGPWRRYAPAHGLPRARGSLPRSLGRLPDGRHDLSGASSTAAATRSSASTTTRRSSRATR